MMPDKKPQRLTGEGDIVALLERYQEEIATGWTERCYPMVEHYKYYLTRDEWRVGMYPFLAAMFDAIGGNYTSLDRMLEVTSSRWNFLELDIGGFLAPMLEFTDVVRSVVRNDETIDSDYLLEFSNHVERCVNYIAVVYASRYTAEVNRLLSGEQAQMALVFNVLDAAGSVLSENSILCAIAESIAYQLGRKYYICLPYKRSNRSLAEIPICSHLPESGFDFSGFRYLKDLVTARFDEAEMEMEVTAWYWRDTQVLLRSQAGKARLRSALFIPLRCQEGLIAVIAIAGYETEMDRPFSQPEINLAQSLAQSANQALQNVDLHREVRQRAIAEERQRLSQEFHDEQAQILGAVKWRLSTIERLLSENRIDEARSSLAELENITDQGYSDVRDAIVMLRIASALDVDFLNTMRKVVDQYRELHADLQVELVVQDCPNGGISASAQLQIIRIVQEALANVWQHARATRVDIGLWRDGTQMALKIEDDGCGFTPARLEQEDREHFGLSIMKERAKSAGGSLEIHSSPGNGTRVLFRLALRDKNWREKHEQS